MALNLSLSAIINVERTTITITDTTTNWDDDSNPNFTDIGYAEMYVGIKGALYGPVILTPTFTAATAQSDLVFTITPSILGLEGTVFDDGVQEYHYGVSESASPSVVDGPEWNGETAYSFPTTSTNNKIPFLVQGDEARSYILQATYNFSDISATVNPRMTLNVNYQDGTKDTAERVIPTGSQTLTATVNVNRQKEIRDITGFLFNEDNNPPAQKTGTIQTITLTKRDLDLTSTVERALISEKTKTRQNKEAIAFRNDFLCGRRDFINHEKFIVEVTALDSVTIGATRGLAEETEQIIDILNDNTTC